MQNALFALERFVQWLLETSWQAGGLVCAILLVRAVFGHRLSPRWRHALWLLVMFRLVMPVAPGSPTSMFNVARLWQRPAAATPIHAMSTAVQSPSRAALSAVAPAISDANTPPVTPEKLHMPPLAMAGLVWLAVALALTLRTTVLSSRLFAGITRRRAVTDQSLLDALEDCRKELDVRVPVSLVPSPHIKTPAIVGFLRPRLLLPEQGMNNLSIDELRDIFLHELAHVRRLDVAINSLMSLLHTLHWFNPLIWVAVARMRVDQEQACDSLVIATTGKRRSSSYGETILTLLNLATKRRRMPAVAGILEDKAEIATRLRMLGTYGPRSYSISPLAVGLIAMLAVVGLTSAQAPQALSPKPQAEAPAIVSKMKSIIIPEINFQNANIRDVIDFLRRESIKHDRSNVPQQAKGINILLDLRSQASSNSDNRSGKADASELPHITFSARAISLFDAIRIITQVANLTWQEEGSVLMLRPAISQEATESGSDKQRNITKARFTAMANVTSKMKQIKIPEINFKQANIRDVINFLHSASVKYDLSNVPQRAKGVHIVLDLKSQTSSNSDNSSGTADASELPDITFSMFGETSLFDAIQIVTSVTDLAWHIEGSSVLITPRARQVSPKTEDDIYMRTYKVTPYLAKVLEEAGSQQTEAMFRQLNVPQPEGSSMKYVPDAKRFVVANTKENLEIIEAILANLQ